MFRTFTPIYRLNITTSALLEGWVWYYITVKGWYAINNQMNLSNNKSAQFLDCWSQVTAAIEKQSEGFFQTKESLVKVKYGMW